MGSTTTQGVKRYDEQSAFCDKCGMVGNTHIILDLDTGVEYFTCPNCDSANKR